MEDAAPGNRPPNDQRLRFIDRFEHRGHIIKIVRRGNELRLLIYPPQSPLATRRVSGPIDEFPRLVDAARRKVDGMIAASS